VERDDRTADPRRAWLVSGVLLLVGPFLAPILHTMPVPVPWLGFVLAAVYPAALIVYAYGLPGGSVTARRPLGTAALTVLAAWILATSIAWPPILGPDPDEGLIAVFVVVDPVVRVAAALIAVVQIGRARVVPPPWNWAPSWALAAIVVTGVGGQAVAMTSPANGLDLTMTLFTVDSLVRAAASVLLGVLSIVLAARRAPAEPVVVYRSPDGLDA